MSRPDWRCEAALFKNADGGTAECPGQCCSNTGFCGSTSDHCECVGCVDYKEVYKTTGYFACADGQRKIRNNRKCDGQDDCSDCSDETEALCGKGNTCEKYIPTSDEEDEGSWENY